MSVIFLLRCFIVNSRTFSAHSRASGNPGAENSAKGLGPRFRGTNGESGIPHSSEMPFALMIFAHFSISAAMNVAR